MYELLAEGGANQLYRRADNTVIRVSKRGANPRDVASYWNSFWRPKLGPYMGQMEPVEDSVFGPCLLIDEVGAGNAEIVAEFKPKWLAQSPAAPRDAIACRTCAIRTQRGQDIRWCSLDLAAPGAPGVQELLGAVTVPCHRDAVELALSKSRILEQLKYLQLELAETSLPDCMSLRDCTILIERREAGDYKCWVVDLDPKDGVDKLSKWQKMEDELKPFYTQRNAVCRLSRKDQTCTPTKGAE